MAPYQVNISFLTLLVLSATAGPVHHRHSGDSSSVSSSRSLGRASGKTHTDTNVQGAGSADADASTDEVGSRFGMGGYIMIPYDRMYDGMGGYGRGYPSNSNAVSNAYSPYGNTNAVSNAHSPYGTANAVSNANSGRGLDGMGWGF